jgi:hypothetical protein
LELRHENRSEFSVGTALVVLTRRGVLAAGASLLSEIPVGRGLAENEFKLRFVGLKDIVKGIDIAAPIDDFAASSFGLPPARLSALHAAGFNTLRCFISLSQFIDARTDGAMDAVVGKWAAHIAKMTSAGFKVCVSWDSSYRERMDICQDPPNTARFAQAIGALSRRLERQFPPGQIALELMNEPPRDDDLTSGASWNAIAAQVFQAARDAAPNLTVVIQPSELGFSGSLLKLPVSAFDLNVMYSFHWYAPAAFTHQSVGPPPPFRGLYRVPYPVSYYPGGKTKMIADMRDRVNGDPGISETQKALQIARNTVEVEGLFFASAPLGTPPLMAGAWLTIDDWLSAHPQLQPKQILMGEFGVNGDINRNNGTNVNQGGLAADLRSRCNYLKDASSAVKSRNWGGWIVHQAMGDFNVFEQSSFSVHGVTLISEIVTALFS